MAGSVERGLQKAIFLKRRTVTCSVPNLAMPPTHKFNPTAALDHVMDEPEDAFYLSMILLGITISLGIPMLKGLRVAPHLFLGLLAFAHAGPKLLPALTINNPVLRGLTFAAGVGAAELGFRAARYVGQRTSTMWEKGVGNLRYFVIAPMVGAAIVTIGFEHFLHTLMGALDDGDDTSVRCSRWANAKCQLSWAGSGNATECTAMKLACSPFANPKPMMVFLVVLIVGLLRRTCGKSNDDGQLAKRKKDKDA